MAVVQGIMERVHYPVYDSLTVDPEEQLGDVEKTGVLKFFVNVQGKTKVETNLQAASLLPHYNTFEARALRVVISDQPPQFPDDETADDADTGYDVVVIDGTGTEQHVGPDGTVGVAQETAVTADLQLSLARIAELLVDAREGLDGYVDVDVTEEGVTLRDAAGNELTSEQVSAIDFAGAVIPVHKDDLQGQIELFDDTVQPPIEQLRLNDGAGTLIGKVIYNTVTTFYVGEKAMIQMPTWFFPAGAGPASDSVKLVTHGDPSPLATFRFAEPIYIDRQQPFRVDIEVPDADVLSQIKRIYGPFQIWVVLDGFMTRGVQ